MRAAAIIWLLLAGATQAGAAQAGELKLATWSQTWLTVRPAGDPALPADVRPKSADDLNRLAGYASALDADIVALQEVDGAAMAARLFPPDRYRIVMAQGDAALNVGIAVRRGLDVTVNPELSALDPYPGARFHLRAGVDVIVHAAGADLRVLAVHLKAGCRDDALDSPRPQCRTLQTQLSVLRGWVEARQAEGVAFAVLGDFNRHIEAGDPVAAGLARATDGHANPCWGHGGFVDHILAGGPARQWLLPETLRVLVYRETDPEWRDRLSDHCPVSVRLRLPDAPH